MDNSSHPFSLAAGNVHSLFLDDNNVWACGLNTYGQTGLHVTKSDAQIIQMVQKIQMVACGSHTSFFIDASGQVYGCGWNQYYQLALGEESKIEHPQEIPNLPKVMFVSGGARHSLFLDLGGQVWVCGNNEDGQAGRGEIPIITIPDIIDLPAISCISAGNYFSLFLDYNGCVWSCGENSKGQLGLGDTAMRTTPCKLTSRIPTITFVSAGYSHSLFIDENGSVWITGLQDDKPITSAHLSPSKVYGLPLVQMVATAKHSLYLDYDGRVWANGENKDFQASKGLGMIYDPVLVPIPGVPGICKIIHIAAGLTHSLFLDETGAVYSCGNSNYCQTGFDVHAVSFFDCRKIPRLPKMRLKREIQISAQTKSARSVNNHK